MLYSIVFVFYTASGDLTYKMGDAWTPQECKARAYQMYRVIEIKPNAMYCWRKA